MTSIESRINALPSGRAAGPSPAPWDPEGSFARRIGSAGRSFAGSSLLFGPVRAFGRAVEENPYRAALMAFGAAGVPAFLFNYLRARRHGEESPMKRGLFSAALLGGGAALGAGLFSSMYRGQPEMQAGFRRKAASFAGGPADTIASRLARDHTVPPDLRWKLSRLIDQLPPEEQVRLARLIAATAGAGAAAIVARFLLRLGIGGTALAAIAGAAAGSMFSAPPVNAGGQRYLGGSDFFGNPRF